MTDPKQKKEIGFSSKFVWEDLAGITIYPPLEPGRPIDFGEAVKDDDQPEVTPQPVVRPGRREKRG